MSSPQDKFDFALLQLEPLAKDLRDCVAKMASKEGPQVDKSLRELESRLVASMKEMVSQEVRQALIIHSASLTRSV